MGRDGILSYKFTYQLITDKLSVGGENTREKCAQVARRIVIAVKDV